MQSLKKEEKNYTQDSQLKFKYKMKKILFIGLIASTIVACNSTPSFDSKAEPKLTNGLDSASYMLGIEYGAWLKSMGNKDLNYEMFATAVKASLHEDSVYIDEMSRGTFLRGYFQDLDLQRVADLEAKYAPQKEAAEAWLAGKAKEEGVKELQKGLYYKVIQEGSGIMPKDGDNVSVLYTGKFTDGKIFDTTSEDGEPRTFNVNRVIPGWTNALKAMPKGSKWEVYISPDLAYGLEPDPRSGIEPNSALMFEVELVDVIPAPAK